MCPIKLKISVIYSHERCFSKNHFLLSVDVPLRIARYNYSAHRSARLSITAIHLVFVQAIYKQLALGWQIAKQISELNPPSLSNNKNYR